MVRSAVSGIRSAIIAVLVAALALTGCSAVRFVYNQAPEFSFWYIDGYFDLDDPQTPLVRNGVAAWFAWHRRTQLPDYADLLVRAQAEVQQDTTPERACAWWGVARERFDAMYEQALPVLADLALSLKAPNFEQLKKRQAKVNAEYADDFLQKDPKDRLAAGVKRAVERAERLYGTLDDAQRALIVRQAELSPFDPEAALAERKLRQAELTQILRALSAGGANRGAAQMALRGYAQRAWTSPREPYRRYIERLTEFTCQAAATFHNTTSAAQRRTAVERLKGWEADARALAAEAP
jgi:hypothetical protein